MSFRGDTKELKKQLRRAAIAVMDLGEATTFIAYAPRARPWHEREALCQAFIVSYARAFVNSAPHEDSARALPGRVLRGLSPEQKRLHKEILELRDSVVAHSDYELNRIASLEVTPTGWSIASERTSVSARLGRFSAVRELATILQMRAQEYETALIEELRSRAA